MPETSKLAKASIREIWFGSDGAVRLENPNGAPAKNFDVQFNPHTLKLTYATQKKDNEQPKGSAVQYLGPATTKLTMELVFDATLPVGAGGGRADDVRTLTQQIAYFLIPQDNGIPPGIQFHWGATLFQGVLDSMDETIDLFDAQGTPLRATVNVSMTQQRVTYDPNKTLGGGIGGLGGGGGFPGVPGTSPLAAARGGETLAQMAGRAGLPDWRAAADANNVDNPRQLASGALLDLNVRIAL